MTSGFIVMSYQFFVALGIAAGFLVPSLVDLITRTCQPGHRDCVGNRWQTASVLLPLMILLVVSMNVQESPGYLMTKGRLPQAFSALCALRETPLQAARDLYAHMYPKPSYLPGLLSGNQQNGHWTGCTRKLYHELKKIRHFFDLPYRTRRAKMSSILMMATQQLHGLNVIIYYFSKTLSFEGVHTKDLLEPWLETDLISDAFGFFVAYLLPGIMIINIRLLATYIFAVLAALKICLVVLLQMQIVNAATLTITNLPSTKLFLALIYSFGHGAGKQMTQQHYFSANAGH